MGERTDIQWCHHTFNPWWGCTHVSAGCDHCYAERMAKRQRVEWGPRARRRFFGDRHWAEPLRWNRRAERAWERRRVFCGSMCDVVEQLPLNHPDRVETEATRARLRILTDETLALDWLLLTKRPENIPLDFAARRPNLWLGTTVESPDVVRRIESLRCRIAARRFLSLEPLLEPLYLRGWLDGIDWVIVGGESGPKARECPAWWIVDIIEECRRAGVPVFVKQLGTHAAKALGMRHSHGGDPAEWARVLRVREVPG